jgi:dipeptidyl aminopeptidase/acylaminoacyl peptidase
MSFAKQSPYVPHPYEQIREGVLPSIVAEPVYESWLKKFRAIDDAETYRIDYESGGHLVNGIFMRPVNAQKGKHPLVIFNRGGRRSYGMLHVLTILNLLHPLVQRGYVLLASNYRGVNGATGEDEFGGAEVGDILALLECGKKLPEWDGKNIFLFGWSRGGMMTLLSLKQGAEVNAAAIGAPLIDLAYSAGETPKQEEWLLRALPDYEAQGFKALEARSAPYWIPKLRNTPLLIMHGDADVDVSVLHSRSFARKLAEKGHPHRYVEYPGGNHYLNPQRAEVIAEVHEWFEKFKKE